MSAETKFSLPYCGPPPSPSDWIGAWNLDPVLLATFIMAAATGAWLLRGASRKRQNAFAFTGIAACLAFISPLCALSVSLFAARTAHHLVIIGALAPALALAFPSPKLPATPALIAVSAALWAWHVPAIYSAAWDSAAVYWALQAALILPAWAFWSAALHSRSHAPILGLMTLVAQMGFLGAVLTFAPHPLYLEHLAHAPAWSLSAHQDQQLAGLIMWVPGMIPTAVLAGVLASRLLRRDMQT